MRCRSLKFEFNFLRKEMINENDNKGTTYGSRIAANNTKQRLRRIACRTAHEWLDQSDEVFEQFHEKHRCDVFVVIYPPKRFKYDPPNYEPTSKALIDGLTDAGIWNDDNYNVIRRTSFEHGGLFWRYKGVESRVSSERTDRIALIHENYGYIERLNCFMDNLSRTR